MTDRWMEEAERLLNSAVTMDMAECADALAAALSDAYEAGRREEREAAAQTVEKLKEDADRAAAYYANLGMIKDARAQRVQSLTFGIASAAIRSREAVE